jgi:hypothetical protein
MYSRNTKTTNQTTANNNKSYAEGFLVVFDMGQCEITLKMSPALYQEEEEEIRQTTGEHLGHLKDIEISKYKRESKGR